jgi:predicted ABC-type ATPase
MKPVLIVLAGPNGAGKSTFFEAFLSNKGLPFINADVLASELNLDALDAAEIAQRFRVNLVERNESFITETVFSDPVGAKLSFFEQAEENGYEVTLIYIGISNVQLSRARVEKRKQAGGHDVPSDKLKGRFQRSLNNVKLATTRLSRVIVFDNSRSDKPFEIVAEFEDGKVKKKPTGSVPTWARALFSNG